VVLSRVLPDVVHVDRRAVEMHGGRTHVRVLGEDGRERLAPVVLGESNDESYVVREGVEPGARVILASD
jgi:hypothetical protein